VLVIENKRSNYLSRHHRMYPSRFTTLLLAIIVVVVQCASLPPTTALLSVSKHQLRKRDPEFEEFANCPFNNYQWDVPEQMARWGAFMTYALQTVFEGNQALFDIWSGCVGKEASNIPNRNLILSKNPGWKMRLTCPTYLPA
jgi:hypothetical protein